MGGARRGGDTDSASPSLPSGQAVVFRLLLALAAATALILLLFAAVAPGPARPRILIALAGNLALAGWAYVAMAWLNARRARKGPGRPQA